MFLVVTIAVVTGLRLYVVCNFVVSLPLPWVVLRVNGPGVVVGVVKPEVGVTVVLGSRGVMGLVGVVVSSGVVLESGPRLELGHNSVVLPELFPL